MRKRAGIDAKLVESLPEAERGTIGLGKDGAPNGFLVDAGWDRVAAVLPHGPGPAAARRRERGTHQQQPGHHGVDGPGRQRRPGEPLFALKPTEKSVGVLPVYKALAEKAS